MSLKIKTHKFESRVAPAAQRRPFGRRAESRKNEEAEIKDKQYYLDMFDKAYKECVQLDIDDGGDGQEWARYFAMGDDPNYFSQKEAEEIVGYYMEFHPNLEGETDRPYQDWLENMNLANGDNPPTKMDREVTRILKALYAADESKKSEDYKNFTLKQLRFQLKNGWAKDLTNASDEEIQEIIDSGHEISGVSNGTYGMNGLKVTYRNPDGSIGSGVVIGRTPNLFALLSPQKPKKAGDAPKPSESKKSEAVDDSKTIKMNVDYNTFMRLCYTAAYLTSDENYWDALWEYYSDFGEITEDADVFFDNLFQYTDWKSEEDLYDESLPEKYKDDSKSKAECIEAAVDAGDLDVFKTDKGYLVIQ